MSDNILEINHLTISHKHLKYPIVSDLSLQVRPKEAVGIVGESGCGKSLTSLATIGLLPKNLVISNGVITFKGKDMSGLSKKEWESLRGKELSMIFQEPSRALHPLHTVGKQIEESFAIHTSLSKTERKQKTLEIMKAVGIKDPEKRYHQFPHQLSGGLNQRVMIAMAIALRPSLLLADEPTTALDVTIQSQILALLRRLKRELGISYILISHDLSVICENCEYIYVMYAGQIVEQATTENFLSHPCHPYTKALIKASPDPGKKIEQLTPIPGTVPSLRTSFTGCRFAPRCPYATAICNKTSPPLYHLANDTYVRCHHYKEESI